MRVRIRGLLQNLALLLAALTVTAVAGEVGVRLIRPQPLEAAYVFPDGTLRHRPSFSYRYTRKGFSNLVTFNAIGLRGPEVAARRQSGVPRVLFMGDSFVEGKQVGDDEVLTAVLSRLLEESGRPSEVINAGVAGAGTGEEILLWDRLGRSLAPDLVVLGFYPNDVRNNVERRYFAARGGEVVQVRQPRLPRVRWIYDARNYLAAHSHLYMLVRSAHEAWRERGEAAARGARGDEPPAGVPVPMGDVRIGDTDQGDAGGVPIVSRSEDPGAGVRPSALSRSPASESDAAARRSGAREPGTVGGQAVDSPPATSHDRRADATNDRTDPAGRERIGLLETEEVFEIDPAPEIAEGWDLTEALLAEMKRRVEASGARFVVAIFPTRFQVDERLWLAHAREVGIDPGRYDLEIPGKRLAAWTERYGADVVDLLPAFREANRGNSFYHVVDAHWNPDGHRLAAEVIEGALLARDLP